MDSGQNLLTSDVIVRKIRTPGTWTTLSYFISFHVDLLWVPSCLLCSGAYEYPGSLNWDYTNGIGWIRPWTASVAHVSIKMSSTESGYLLHLDTVQLLAQLSFSVLIYFSQSRFWNIAGLVCWRYPLDILTSGGPLPPPFVACPVLFHMDSCSHSNTGALPYELQIVSPSGYCYSTLSASSHLTFNTTFLLIRFFKSQSNSYLGNHFKLVTPTSFSSHILINI